jgi:hypothetical protein
MSKKEKIGLFYEQEIRKYIEEDYARGIHGFKEEYQIGRSGFSARNDETPELGGSCQLKMVSGTLPINVLKNFYKHFWYAHRCRTSCSLLEISLEETTTYAFLISGYADDGWDCSGKWIEVYDNDSIVGSILIPDIDDPEEWGNWKWLSRPLKGNDFNGHSVPGLLILD